MMSCSRELAEAWQQYQGSLLQNLMMKMFLFPVFRLPQLHHKRTFVPVAARAQLC